MHHSWGHISTDELSNFCSSVPTMTIPLTAIGDAGRSRAGQVAPFTRIVASSPLGPCKPKSPLGYLCQPAPVRGSDNPKWRDGETYSVNWCISAHFVRELAWGRGDSPELAPSR